MADAFLTRPAIAQRQLHQLQALLSAIVAGNRFYRDKLDAARAPYQVERLTQYYETVPFTTKAELAADQLAHAPFGTNLTFPLERYTRFHQTSGTAGAPLRWLDTPESWEWMLQSWEEVLRVAGVTRSDRVLFAFSFGPFIGFWLAFEAASRLGALALPGGGLSSIARLRLLHDCGATVLCCTPTYAIRLAEVAAQEKITSNKSLVRLLIVAGEPGGSIPATRRAIETLWPGARLFDHHGMTEVGPVSYECPARPGVLHVIESAYLPEVIDPKTHCPVTPGETGELILTTLGRVGSPLLRYRTGDLVRSSASPVCVCGRSELALEGGILGRTDDMLVVRGVNVYPSAVEEILRSLGGIAEYQVHVQVPEGQGLVELTVEIEPEPGVEARTLVHRVENAFQSALALRVPVTARLPGALPRFELKAKRWVQHRSG